MLLYSIGTMHGPEVESKVTILLKSYLGVGTLLSRHLVWVLPALYTVIPGYCWWFKLVQGLVQKLQIGRVTTRGWAGLGGIPALYVLARSSECWLS